MSYHGVFRFSLWLCLVVWMSGCATTGQNPKNTKQLPPLKTTLAPDEQRVLALDLAALYLRYGQPEQARPILNHLRAKDPYDPAVLRLLAHYYMQIGKPVMGVKALQLLDKKHGLTQEDEALLGRIALRAGYFKYAENIFKKWTQSCKALACARAWNNLGITYMAEKNYRKARSAFIKALEYDPLDETARHNLQAVIQMMSGK